MPTHLQNFLITKPSVEEFVEHLWVTRAVAHASPRQPTARSHRQQPPRTHHTPPRVETGEENRACCYLTLPRSSSPCSTCRNSSSISPEERRTLDAPRTPLLRAC